MVVVYGELALFSFSKNATASSISGTHNQTRPMRAAYQEGFVTSVAVLSPCYFSSAGSLFCVLRCCRFSKVFGYLGSCKLSVARFCSIKGHVSIATVGSL